MASSSLFRFDAPEPVLDWQPINDGVMGGVSNGRLRYDPKGFAVFEGHVSLENRGGFASVRSRVRPIANVDATSYSMEVFSDGKRYKLNLRTDDAFDGVSYQASFEPAPGRWSVVKLPVLSFSSSFRGRAVPGAPVLDSRKVRQYGLMIADHQSGPFELRIRSIELA